MANPNGLAPVSQKTQPKLGSPPVVLCVPRGKDFSRSQRENRPRKLAISGNRVSVGGHSLLHQKKQVLSPARPVALRKFGNQLLGQRDGHALRLLCLLR